jgi:hypothetical protein
VLIFISSGLSDWLGCTKAEQEEGVKDVVEVVNQPESC